VEEADPAEIAFGVILAIGCCIMLFLGVAIGGLMTGTLPEILTGLQSNFLIYLVATAILVIILAVVGVVLASAARSRRAAAQTRQRFFASAQIRPPPRCAGGGRSRQLFPGAGR
jgi:K+-transporting ATPase A subunit